MVLGAVSIVGSSVVDSLPTTMSLKSGGSCGGDIVNVHRTSLGSRTQVPRPGSLELGSSFLESKKIPSCTARRPLSKKQRRRRTFRIVNELAGQYEDSFEDVKTQMLNYFTYKAVRTVLNQLYEMNPTQYRWFYEFIVSNKPGDGKLFIRTLWKEKHDLAERVMITRLHLYAKWIKKCNHAEIYQEISDENLELMRERLMETVIWPSDDTNTEKIG